MIIQSIDVVPLNLHYTPELMAHMPRSAHRGRLVLYRVHLADGTVGYGEEIGDPQDPAPYVGTDAVAGLRAIRHTGVQMACYDAVGKALGVPAHALMGRQVRSRVPFAYWTIDLPPDVWAAQAARAASLGYTVYKFKCRPWWDPVEQVARVAQAVPKGFTFWLDFNGHLREVRQALPVLQALAQYDCVGGFESPIPQRDAAGYRLLRQKIDRPIAAHFGSGCCHVRSDPGFDRGVPALTQIAEGLCDAFVFGGGDVETLRSQAAVAAEARIPFWIQTVGGGLRAAWVMHLASTCRQGTLSHLAAHEIWAEDVATPPRPTGGWVAVPDGPGLGVAVDEAAVARLQAGAPMAEPRRIAVVIYPDGTRWHFGSETQRHEAFYFGDLPGFVPGIRLEMREDDGSADFADLYARCATAPVMSQG